MMEVHYSAYHISSEAKFLSRFYIKAFSPRSLTPNHTTLSYVSILDPYQRSHFNKYLWDSCRVPSSMLGT